MLDTHGAARSNHRASLALGLAVAVAIGVRCLAAIVIGIAAALADARPTHACTDADQGRGCFALDRLRFDHVGHTLTLIHVADLTATAATAGDVTVDAATGLGATYVATFGRGGHPEYQLAASLGATVHHLAGTIDATGAGTHAELRLGPAIVADGDAENRRTNTVSVPLTLELAHDGELAALPRLSARPDVARARYGWQHVELATRVLRIEMEGSANRPNHPVGPGARVPVPMAFDLLTFHAAVDVTSQDDGRRVEGALGGALLEVATHGALSNLHVAFLDFDHRAVALPDDQRAAVDTVWVLRADLTSPRTGARYRLGWGAIVNIPGRTELERELDIDDGELDVASAGWWHERAWGGVGWQYERTPYVTMAAQPAVEDRWSLEAYRAGVVDVRAQAYVARTRRWIDDAWQRDTSGGVSLDAHRRIGDVDATLATELGRSFYGALDGQAPSLGFAGRATLTIRAAADHAWTW